MEYDLLDRLVWLYVRISVILLASTGCMDPAAPRAAPDDLDRALAIYAILDPDVEQPSLAVSTAFIRDTVLEGLTTRLRRSSGDDEMVKGTSVELGVCFPSGFYYATTVECQAFPEPIASGRTYTVTAEAASYPAVSGTTVIPGPFEITDVDAAGEPPGTARLDAAWTVSRGAHGYVVGVRADTTVCHSVYGCDGWFAVTANTQFSGRVPGHALQQGRGPWSVYVYALDRHLYEYLTSGTNGDLFSVPPAENVVGGYGVVGSWVRRWIELR